MESRLGETPLDPVAEAALKQHVREEDDWKTSMDEEKALGGLSWDTLVFHLHKIASSLTLSDNFALTQLQVKTRGQRARGPPRAVDVRRIVPLVAMFCVFKLQWN